MYRFSLSLLTCFSTSSKDFDPKSSTEQLKPSIQLKASLSIFLEKLPATLPELMMIRYTSFL